MSGFPDHFRDLTAFSGDGLEYSTTSDTAVKMFDAVVNMVPIDNVNNDKLNNYHVGYLPLQQQPTGWLGRSCQGNVLCGSRLCHGQDHDQEYFNVLFT